MKLIKFLNDHPNDWQQLLAAAPYCISATQDSNYWLLRYNQYESDFNLDEVKEARGSIFTYEDGIWKCVARALDKFHNWGESYAATPLIHWNDGVDVLEKIDGSLIKVWWHDRWHVSTNNCIDAFATTGATARGVNFGNLFMTIANAQFGNGWMQHLNKEYCYYFELVAPSYNTIVVQYQENRVWFLGCRNMVTMEESATIPETFQNFVPRTYHFNSLDDCIEASHTLDRNHEGFVVRANTMYDGSFLRIKVKGDEYLRLHHTLNNGVITDASIVEMWQNNTLDDFVGSFPQFNDRVAAIVSWLHEQEQAMKDAWQLVQPFGNDRKQFAALALQYPGLVRNFLFNRLDNKCDNAHDYLVGMEPRTLIKNM